MVLSAIHVVLARPSDARNVGAACRAMKNFGISRLTVVTSTAFDWDAARPLAIGADDVLADARIVDSLEAALAGDSLVAGITRRLGQRRKSSSRTPWEFAATLGERGEQPTAIVFGNERSGLSDAELEHCHLAVSIPTSPDCPSLNLSHAVEVIAYEIFKAAGEAAGYPTGTAQPGRSSYPTTDRLDDSAVSIVSSLESLGFGSREGPQGIRLFMRDVMARASLDEAELERFESVFVKLAGMHRGRDDS
ncbi:MAG TPA: RNA methyltransferase [Spirochaetia bacterium]|nr:RNA methyltransferase [Spirochaetia bacterium]